MNDTPHGEEGHINTVIRDQDSEITGFGQHNRIVVFGDPSGHIITAREDIKHNLPMSTDAQRRKVMNGYQRMHPRGSRLMYDGGQQYKAAGNWESIDHTYRIVRR